jgi:hypothetical protein
LLTTGHAASFLVLRRAVWPVTGGVPLDARRRARGSARVPTAFARCIYDNYTATGGPVYL